MCGTSNGPNRTMSMQIFNIFSYCSVSGWANESLLSDTFTWGWETALKKSPWLIAIETHSWYHFWGGVGLNLSDAYNPFADITFAFRRCKNMDSTHCPQTDLEKSDVRAHWKTKQRQRITAGAFQHEFWKETSGKSSRSLNRTLSSLCWESFWREGTTDWCEFSVEQSCTTVHIPQSCEWKKNYTRVSGRWEQMMRHKTGRGRWVMDGERKLQNEGRLIN